MLTRFRQGNRSVNEWYNVVQTQVSIVRYPPETACILNRGIFCFLLKDEEFVCKTIKDSNIGLEMFPASNLRQLAKKIESSKSSTRHIKQRSSDPQAAQVNFMRNQRTDLQSSKSKQNQYSHKQRSKTQKRYSSEHKNERPPLRCLIQAKHIKEEIDVQSVVTPSM